MRGYQQFCGVAKALDVVGERWTLLIVRDLMLGGRRYSDLHRSLEGITTNLLAARLKHLIDAGLVSKRRLPPPAPAVLYELTEKGRGLEPAVLALGAFGSQYLTAPGPDDRVNKRWALVSLRRRFRGIEGRLSIALVVDDEPFAIDLEGDQIHVRDGRPAAADLVIEGDSGELFAWYSGRSAIRITQGATEDLARFEAAIGVVPPAGFEDE